MQIRTAGVFAEWATFAVEDVQHFCWWLHDGSTCDRQSVAAADSDVYEISRIANPDDGDAFWAFRSMAKQRQKQVAFVMQAVESQSKWGQLSIVIQQSPPSVGDGGCQNKMREEEVHILHRQRHDLDRAQSLDNAVHAVFKMKLDSEEFMWPSSHHQTARSDCLRG